MTRGRDALAAMPKIIIGEISPNANATLWAWLSRVPIDLKTSRSIHSEMRISKTMMTGGKRLGLAAKPPASSQDGKNVSPIKKHARGLHLRSALTLLRKSAGHLF